MGGPNTASLAYSEPTAVLPAATKPMRVLPWAILGGVVVLAGVAALVFSGKPSADPAVEPPGPPAFSFDGSWRVSRGDGIQWRTPFVVDGDSISLGGEDDSPDGSMKRRVPQRWTRDGNTLRLTNNNESVTALEIDPADPDTLTGTGPAGVRIWWDRVKPDDPWPSRFVPLFDGTILNDWREVGSPDVRWGVLDGKLTGRNRSAAPRSDGWLLTQRPPYRNVRVKVEIGRTGHDTGIGVRLKGVTREDGAGYVVVVRGLGAAGGPLPTGTLLRFNPKAPPKVLSRPTRGLDKPGMNLIEIDAIGREFVVRVNGEAAGSATDSEYETGDLGIHCRGESSVSVSRFEADRRPD